MIVKAIYEPNFGDKTTGSTYENQIKRRKGDIFECDNKLAKERIKKGFVVEATDEEKEAYKKQQEELLNAQVEAKKDLETDKTKEDSDKKSQTDDESTTDNNPKADDDSTPDTSKDGE